MTSTTTEIPLAFEGNDPAPEGRLLSSEDSLTLRFYVDGFFFAGSLPHGYHARLASGYETVDGDHLTVVTYGQRGFRPVDLDVLAALGGSRHIDLAGDRFTQVSYELA